MKLAALAVIGMMANGCMGLRVESVDPDDNIVTLTATVGFGGGAATRALTPEGVKTFAAGDQIAIIYTDTRDATVKAVTAELTPDDISDGGKTAAITVTLKNPKAGGALKYIYPASMAKDDGSVNYDGLATQDGTLATLARSFDYCTYEGTLTEGATLPLSALMKNQLAIVKFTVRNSGGMDVTHGITGLSVDDGTHFYSILPVGQDTIYAALRPVDNASLSFTAADASDLYVKAVTGKTLEANSLYPVTLTMTAAVPVVGHFLNRDGSITSTKQTGGDNESYAVIAYVGAVAHYFDRFIALALEDVDDKGHGIGGKNGALALVDTYAANHPVTIGGKLFNTNTGGTTQFDYVPRGAENPSNVLTGDVVQGWRLPCVTDFRYVFQGLCGGPSATDPVGLTSYANYGSGSAMVSAINAACGNTGMQVAIYQSSSKGVYWWCYRFEKSQFWDYPDNGFLARAVFAF